MSDKADRALRAAQAYLEERKAFNLATLELTGRCAFADHFIICHGESERQVKSLAEGVEKAVRDETGLRPKIEGQRTSDWILLDYGDFIVHVFSEGARDFYRLESLWYDAPPLDTLDASGNAGEDA